MLFYCRVIVISFVVVFKKREREKGETEFSGYLYLNLVLRGKNFFCGFLIFVLCFF